MNRPARRLAISRRQALAGVAAAAVAATLPSIALAAPSTGADPAASPNLRPVGYLYVNLNTAGANLVAGYQRFADGTIAPLSGSPFTAGGTGSGASLSSQGSIAAASNGRYLLVADAGSNQISVLHRAVNGSLVPISGSPFGSGGNYPVSIAVSRSFVYVANQGNGGSNYTGFDLAANGILTPISGSTIPLPDGSGVADVLFSAKGSLLAGTRANTSLIDSFVVAKDGLLSLAPGSPYPAQGPGPFGSAYRAGTAPRLYVSNAHGGANAGSVSAFGVADNGALSSVGTSPYPDQQTAPCWVTLSPDGQYLFTANAGSDSISGYAVAPDGSLSLLGSTVVRGGPGVGVFDLAVDPTGRYLYAVDDAIKAISILAITNGVTTEIGNSPVYLPSTSTPFGIVLV